MRNRASAGAALGRKKQNSEIAAPLWNRRRESACV
jgi:hypothetical protein